MSATTRNIAAANDDFLASLGPSTATPEPYADVPDVLKAYPNWVCWKVIIRDGKPDKIPFDAKTGECASPTDPTTWSTFKQAVTACEDGDYAGIGFEFGHNKLGEVGYTPYEGIDFDGLLDANGVADPYALAIIAAAGNPYCDVSPSKTGFHAVVEGHLPANAKNKFMTGKHRGIEIYDTARYFTTTGERLAGSGVPKVDSELVYLLVSQFKDAKFKKLWLGDTSAQENDHSKADIALMCTLARLTNCNPGLMETYFSVSALGQRDKWRERRENYRLPTIQEAIRLVGKKPDAPSDTQNEDEPIITRARDIVPKQIRWLWDGKIPLGKIVLFAGNPDNGKSLASTSVAAITSTGEPFAGEFIRRKPADVLLMIGEDDADDTAVPRLMAAGADMDRVEFLDSVRPVGGEPREVRLDKDIRTIEKRLAANPNIRLLIIDPISNYLGNVSMMQEQEVRSILIPLKRTAEKYKVAIIIVMHLNKKNDLDAIARVGGAMAFVGVARCSWVFARNVQENEISGEHVTLAPATNADTFSMMRIKNNLVSFSRAGLAYSVNVRPILIEGEQINTPYAVWGKDVHGDVNDAINPRGSRRSQSKHEDRHAGGRPSTQTPAAEQWLNEALQDGKQHAIASIYKDAKDRAGISHTTLFNAYKNLVVAKAARKAAKTSTGGVWQLIPLNASTETLTQQSDLVQVEGAL